MAFVSKQERDNSLTKSETRNIGPGEYYANNDNDPDKEIKNCYPFNLQADRVTLEIPYEQKIRNIGPGTYEANSSFLKKSFSTRTVDYFNTLDKSLLDVIERTKELQSKDSNKMIKESLLIKKLQPKRDSQQQRDSKSKPKQHVRIYDTTNSSLRVVSIPLKNSHGYVFDEDNNPILVEEPSQVIKRSRDGRYSQSQEDNKIKQKLRGIEWSKMSIKHSTANTSSNNSYIDPLTQQSLNAENISYNNDRANKNYLSRINKNHREYKAKTSVEDQIIEDVLARPPGPGYYWNEDDNPFIKRLKNKPKPFCSNVERKCQLLQTIKENNLNVGPGSYYKTRYIPKYVNNYPFNANEEKIPDGSSKENPYLGPGSYNIRKELKVIKPSSIYFGSLNRRFNYHIKEENINPGPGEYNPLLPWGKEGHSPVNSGKINKIVESKEFYSPGAGEYNQDIAYSIEYKNKSNENKLQSFIAPFNSGTERFIYNSNSMNDLLGPGCYHHEKKQNKKQKAFPKIVSSNNYNDSPIKDQGLGPGTYNEYNYYHWNKRSYNVNFI